MRQTVPQGVSPFYDGQTTTDWTTNLRHESDKLVYVEFFDDSLQFPGAVSSRRSAAGLDDDNPCDFDVEGELSPELNDNPGTTRCTHFSVSHEIFFPCLLSRGF